VDVELARRFIRTIQPLARLTRRPGLLRGIGGFGGLFEMNSSLGRHPVLVASADGVGTKLCLAKRIGWYEPLGMDLVAMNVNDLLCTGAEPLFFLDYIATGRLDPKVLLGVMRGVVRGCIEAHCVLLGGETAQMPLVYGLKDFDLAGFAVGVVERKRLITGEKIRQGDQVLGLASSGLHANGFTLVQRVLSKSQLKLRARELLTPTRIYVRSVLDLLRKKIPVHGIAHVTGGSFSEKIPRILPEGLGVTLHKESWPIPEIFRKIQSYGVSETQMYRTFNMGIGMVVVLSSSATQRAQRTFKRHGVDNWVIGEVTPGNRKVQFSAKNIGVLHNSLADVRRSLVADGSAVSGGGQ